MKKILFAIVAAGVLLAGCRHQDVPAEVSRAAGRCPIPVEGVGFISAIELHEDTLVYVCNITEPGVNPGALGDDGRDAMKRAMLPEIATLFNDDPGLLDKLKDEQWVLSVRYRSAGGALDIDFAPEEITGETAMQSPEERLADEIRLSRASLPARMTDEISIMGLSDDGRYVVFDCTVDESLAGEGAMEALRASAGEIRSEMEQALLRSDDPDVVRLVDVTTSAGRGIAYRYRGSLSGDTLSIAFAVGDLIR